MGVLSFRIKKIEGDVGERITGELKVSSSPPRIKNVIEREVGLAGNKTKVLAIDFECKTKYEPINAKINVYGEVLYKDERQKEILKKWEKEKKIDEKVGLYLLNYIFKRCAVQCIKIADDLQLPAPVKLPEFVKKEGQ